MQYKNQVIALAVVSCPCKLIKQKLIYFKNFIF